MKKTWMAIIFCAAALAFGACGNENPGGSSGARSTPDIRIGQGSAGQGEEGSLSESRTSDFTYEEKDGKITITEYIGEDKEVVIPSQIDGKDVTALAYGCFYEQGITKVVLPDTLESIDSQAFAYCSELEEVRLNEGLQEIQTQAFEYTSPELTLIVEPGSYAESYAKENGIAYVNAQLSKKEDIVLEEGIAKRIKKVEEYCRVKFPDSYIRFIEKYNVGLPEAHTFQTQDGSYVISQFLGFVEDYQNSPFGEYDIAVVLSPIDTYMTDNPDLIGDELIPVALLTTDDYVCLNFKDNKEEPTVCIWSSTESEEFQPVIYKVADSFLDFAEMLE